jgi:hypothetical protein
MYHFVQMQSSQGASFDMQRRLVGSHMRTARSAIALVGKWVHVKRVEVGHPLPVIRIKDAETECVKMNCSKRR